MRTGTARITASVVGISALVIIAVGPALYWQEIQVQYHLYSLRNDAEYLKEVVTAPDSSPQLLAMTRFLETADGKERLFEVFLEANKGILPTATRSGIPGFLEVRGRIYVTYSEAGGELHIRGMFDDATDSNAEIELRTAIQPLLRNLAGNYYSSHMYDNIIFWFEPRPTGVLETEDMQTLKELFPQDDPTVVFMEHRTTIGER